MSVLVPLTVLAIPPKASAEAMPAHAAPAGTTSTEVAGGRVLVGTYSLAPSQDVLHHALGNVRGYFSVGPALRSAVRSKDGRTTIALFDAALGGEPVRGLLIATTQPGTTQEAWLFDRPARLATSLPRMEASLTSLEREALKGAAPPVEGAAVASADLKSRWAAAAAQARGVALTRTDFPDGTGAIGIAPGYTPTQMQTASVLARSGDGAALRMQGFIGALDPRGNAIFRGGGTAIAEYSPDVATAWQNARRGFTRANGLPEEHLTVESSTPLQSRNGKNGAIVYGYAVPAGKRVAYEAVVTVSPPAGSIGSWGIVFSALWAPVDRFSQDAPALVAMELSYTVDMAKANRIQAQAVGTILARSAAQSQAMLDSNAAARERLARNSATALRQSAEAQDYIQREGASTIHMLKGEDQVYSGRGSREHFTVPLQASSDFVSVPIEQYIKGVDY